jgi:hypothetical protein
MFTKYLKGKDYLGYLYVEWQDELNTDVVEGGME